MSSEGTLAYEIGGEIQNIYISMIVPLLITVSWQLDP